MSLRCVTISPSICLERIDSSLEATGVNDASLSIVFLGSVEDVELSGSAS